MLALLKHCLVVCNFQLQIVQDKHFVVNADQRVFQVLDFSIQFEAVLLQRADVFFWATEFFEELRSVGTFRSLRR